MLGASEKLYKMCGMPADYHITEAARKNDEVQRMEDGEELGDPIDKDNVWHKSTSRSALSLHRPLLYSKNPESKPVSKPESKD